MSYNTITQPGDGMSYGSYSDAPTGENSVKTTIEISQNRFPAPAFPGMIHYKTFEEAQKAYELYMRNVNSNMSVSQSQVSALTDPSGISASSVPVASAGSAVGSASVGSASTYSCTSSIEDMNKIYNDCALTLQKLVYTQQEGIEYIQKVKDNCDACGRAIIDGLLSSSLNETQVFTISAAAISNVLDLIKDCESRIATEMGTMNHYHKLLHSLNMVSAQRVSPALVKLEGFVGANVNLGDCTKTNEDLKAQNEFLQLKLNESMKILADTQRELAEERISRELIGIQVRNNNKTGQNIVNIYSPDAIERMKKNM